MTPRLKSRLLAGLAMAALITFGMSRAEAHYNQMGKERYLAREARLFDRYYASPRPATATFLGIVLLVGGALCLYEAFAFGCYRLMTRSSLSPQSDRMSPPPWNPSS